MNSYDADILFVEDNPDDAELTLRALRKNQFTNSVFRVSDGEEALDFIFAKGKFSGRANSKKPKVILLDLKLPKINGIEVLREIKNHDETKIIPTVILTSSKEEIDIEECYNLGANSYIVKPISFDTFMKTVTDLGLYWLVLNQSFN